MTAAEGSNGQHLDEGVIPANHGLPLRVNFGWTFAGNVVYAASQWGMLAVLAKLGTPESVGQFALGLAVTAPVIILANLSLRAVQATDARQLYEFGHYLALRLVTMFLATLFILGLSLVAYEGEMVWIIAGVGVAKGIESISDVYYGLLQQHEQMDRIAKSLIIKGPLSLVGMAGGYLLTRSVIGAVLGLIIARLILLLVYDVNSPRWLARRTRQDGLPEVMMTARPTWQWHSLAKLSYLSLPLGVTAMLISLNTNLPRYFLERHWSAYELGIFAALAYLFVAGSTVVSALGQSASPRLAKYYAGGHAQQFRQLLVRLVSIALLLGLLAIVVVVLGGRLILTILYEAEYAEYVGVLLWLTLANTLGYAAAFLGYGMTAARYFRVQPFLIGALTLLSLMLSSYLIRDYGLVGAAWVVTGVSAIQFLLSVLVNVHAIRALQRRN
jgi:O-antigen/teichoic acid export membrane protein